MWSEYKEYFIFTKIGMTTPRNLQTRVKLCDLSLVLGRYYKHRKYPILAVFDVFDTWAFYSFGFDTSCCSNTVHTCWKCNHSGLLTTNIPICPGNHCILARIACIEALCYRSSVLSKLCVIEALCYRSSVVSKLCGIEALWYRVLEVWSRCISVSTSFLLVLVRYTILSKNIFRSILGSFENRRI